MKKLYFLIIFMISIFTFNVYATNDVDYTLTITDDYKFKEVIKYSISDYKKIPNGYNYFNDIVNDQIPVYIIGNSKYKKSRIFKNNKYYITLSYTHGEYSMSNVAFLNNCFEKHDYTYDIDTINFVGTGGFNCLDADSLKINIITNFDLSSADALKVGNKYTWTPTDNSFSMKLKITKTNAPSKESSIDYGERYDENGKDPSENNSQDNTTDQTEDQQTPETKDQNPYAGIIIASVFIILSVITIIIIIVLKNKKNSLNKI